LAPATRTSGVLIQSAPRNPDRVSELKPLVWRPVNNLLVRFADRDASRSLP